MGRDSDATSNAGGTDSGTNSTGGGSEHDFGDVNSFGDFEGDPSRQQSNAEQQANQQSFENDPRSNSRDKGFWDYALDWGPMLANFVPALRIPSLLASVYKTATSGKPEDIAGMFGKALGIDGNLIGAAKIAYSDNPQQAAQEAALGTFSGLAGGVANRTAGGGLVGLGAGLGAQAGIKGLMNAEGIPSIQGDNSQLSPQAQGLLNYNSRSRTAPWLQQNRNT